MVLSIAYWSFLMWLSLFTTRKILNTQEKIQNIEEITLNKIVYFLLGLPLLVIAAILIFFLYITLNLLVNFLLPILLGVVIYNIIVFGAQFLLDNGTSISTQTFGYLALTSTTIVYAHVPIAKKLYLTSLTIFKYIDDSDFVHDYIKLIERGVSKGLFRIHIYILLSIVYVSFNIVNFENLLNTDPFKFITEALLTFVIIDTVIVSFKEMKSPKPSTSDENK
ncbi:hypothetical protein [Lysinibacillus sp.]|uniref:hypothetical protein n=1 Tax=Lysinibacillus sp. TaxID=1869345 RepID=UPI0028A1BAAD|nr:hypothetical protein [Lysinibacillus sp.]